MKELPPIGTLWMYTSKGVKKGGGDPFRVLAVTGHENIDGRMMAVAWKCQLMSDETYVSHPAYKRAVRIDDDKKLFVKKGRNGSAPTALFIADSYYKQI